LSIVIEARRILGEIHVRLLTPARIYLTVEDERALLLELELPHAARSTKFMGLPLTIANIGGSRIVTETGESFPLRTDEA
jgi:hypothetical protein